MTSEPDYRRLLHRSIAALSACALLVAVCYWFVDRPVAFFVHDHGLPKHPLLRWLTDPPPIVQSWSPLAIALLMIVRAARPWRRWERVVLAMSLAIIVAEQFRQSLSFVFGRYWPETWIDNNPSLLGNGAYGFNWFHTGRAYGSFPSGHLARTASVASVLWVACPRWRGAAGVAILAVTIGILGMNYHFVSDVIAGVFVGGIVGGYVAANLGLGDDDQLQ
jgi:membrane-associated phospholipid phosphatase